MVEQGDVFAIRAFYIAKATINRFFTFQGIGLFNHHVDKYSIEAKLRWLVGCQVIVVVTAITK
jgi:hypothetical protein